VVDTADRIRDELARYGGLVSDIVRLAGVKVDVAGASGRSPEAVRAEIVEMTKEVARRVVIAIDHVDRLAEDEMSAALEALRFYAAIPYVSIVLALDRRAVAHRLSDEDDRDPAALERLLQVELAVPPVDRALLARVVGGGLERVADRLGRNLDAALPLFDPDRPAGALGLDLVQTPRDAKRAVNALAAAVPMLPPGADLPAACLEILLRLLVPELDGPRLDARRYLRDPAARAALLDELERAVAGHRRATAARAALRALFGT
jgi:hypothetical protein